MRTEPRLVFTLIALTAIPFFVLNMFLPSLEVMANEFKIGYSTMVLAVSVYLFTTAILQLIAGVIADIYGRKRVLLISSVLFIGASIGCAWAESFINFIIFRMFQGAVITAAVLSRAAANDIATPHQATKLLAYISMGMSLAPIIGPSMGGIIAELFGWRTIFLLYVLMGLGMFALVWGAFPKTVQRHRWDNVSFADAYKELLYSAGFWGYVLIMACSIGGFFAFISGVAIVASKQFEMSQYHIGIGMGSISVGFLLGSFLSSILSSTYSLQRMMLLGRIVANVGLLVCFGLLLGGWVRPEVVFAGGVFTGIGNGITLPSANIATMQVKKGLSASASGLSGAVVVFFGAIFGWGVSAALLEQWADAFVLIGFMFVLALISLLITLYVSCKSPNLG